MHVRAFELEFASVCVMRVREEARHRPVWSGGDTVCDCGPGMRFLNSSTVLWPLCGPLTTHPQPGVRLHLHSPVGQKRSRVLLEANGREPLLHRHGHRHRRLRSG